ncbi:MAG TPA: SIMPL domain-containing protein [Nitrososphaera sp.]|nr:SIMPL domain-containing protein [Nitrososphaera sp.]
MRPAWYMNARIVTAIILLGIVAAFALAGAFFGAQSSDIAANAASTFENFDSRTRTLSVTGVSSAKVSPDRVSISFAVESQEKTAEQATKANANITTMVIEALEEVGISGSMSTSYYNVYPIYEYVEAPAECIQYGDGDQIQRYCPPPTARQILLGYKAVNGIVIESAQLDKVGQWIDAAVQAGANRVEYVYFSVSAQRQDEIRNDLIADAVQDARNKAEIALEPLGMEIVDVQSISLDSYPIIYYKRGFEYAAGAPSSTTPIIPGEQEVSVSIHATFQIDGFAGGQTPANTTVYTSTNEEFQVSLDSNPSTGYEWQVRSMDETIAKLVNDEYIPPESGLLGAGGRQVLTFEALEEGKTTIVLEYVRSWEPESPAGVYSVNVIISPNS